MCWIFARLLIHLLNGATCFAARQEGSIVTTEVLFQVSIEQRQGKSLYLYRSSTTYASRPLDAKLLAMTFSSLAYLIATISVTVKTLSNSHYEKLCVFFQT